MELTFAMICWLCALVFIGIGIYANNSKRPMHFWSGTTVKNDKIKDIPGYNRANAFMWSTYGLIYIVIGVIGLIGYVELGGVLIGLTGTLGIPILIYTYYRIYKKYRRY